MGRSPRLGESKSTGGTPLSRNQRTMAMTLSKRRPIRGMEAADGDREGTPVVEDHALRSPAVPRSYPTDLGSIIISTAELGRRSSRPPDHAAESLRGLCGQVMEAPVAGRPGHSSVSITRSLSMEALGITIPHRSWPRRRGNRVNTCCSSIFPQMLRTAPV